MASITPPVFLYTQISLKSTISFLNTAISVAGRTTFPDFSSATKNITNQIRVDYKRTRGENSESFM